MPSPSPSDDASNTPANVPILDLRDVHAFVQAHFPGAANIPWEELPQRMHELPPKGSLLHLFDTSGARLQAAAKMLSARSYHVQCLSAADTLLSASGPSQNILWQPNPFLCETLHSFPNPHGQPRALDLACGAGRDAVFLALQGFAVDAVDLLPDALAKAQDLARRNQATLQTFCVDLHKAPAFAESHYDLITMLRFTHRPLWSQIPHWLRPGGILVIESFHRRDGAATSRSRQESSLLKDGELAQAFPTLEILLCRDGVERAGRWFAQLLAQRPRTTQST